ncbi:chorismate--pyruvate lyase family protein [Herbaspirillum autotrophicum]|uniref:chorismate--pyruvate lyase family protein n=1 Tax=Herbaspirillum autotrophicum TaxID=180195 RepID=UPI00067BF6C5|nr:chorismate lyase [Herbaspirillum autotrophicum]
MAKTHGHAHWFDHLNALQLTPQQRVWLSDRGSMTFRLQARSKQFEVQRLRQRPMPVLADEYAALGVARRSRVAERDVILHCDGEPVIFGHTILPVATSAGVWPFFRRLGSQPLGGSLFIDPLVTRGPFQFARLHDEHPLARRICQALGMRHLIQPLHARRSLFRRKGGVMLVTDIFLPAIGKLMATE